MAEQKRDYYEVLGVDKNADDAAIKKSIPGTGEKIPSRHEPRRQGCRTEI